MNVTSPLMPSLEEFSRMLAGIWESRRLTNSGELHALLERRLAEYLGVPYISLFANGTLPLMVALKALGLEHGEVVTTPYSFVATSHALLWSGMRPVFADIEPERCTLSPECAERVITERTRAIMPVHVYGLPCDVEGFESLGRKYGIPVIYDAAHAFGVRMHGSSLLGWGDMASLSFHATKVFNTVEGGALVCRSAEMKRKIDRLKNFGFAGETSIVGIGINGKLDEVRSAWGLLNLKRVDEAIERRAKLSALYRRRLADTPGVRMLPEPDGVEHNYSHFPVFITEEYPLSRDELYESLKAEGINGRRYFYPLITDFEPYAAMLASQSVHDIPNAREAASQVICLPLYPELREEEVRRICEHITGREP